MMIKVSALAKKFPLAKAKRKKNKANTAIDKDIREQGHWFHAVKDISFECKAGEVLGLLGPNGAGKTTTLRMLSTAIKPTSGQAMIDNVDIVADPIAARKKLGFLSGSTGLYRRLTARENIEYFGRLHKMPEELLQSRVAEFLELLDMKSFADKKADDLSTGMKQKTAIARSVIHDPKVVIFDEPTTGLDVMSAKTILDFIGSYKQRAYPVIFSTHHLHEVEMLCDKIALIDHGTMKFFGDIETFAKHSEQQSLYDAFVNLVETAA